MGRYWDKAIKLLQKEYKTCPGCGASTSNAMLRASDYYMYCSSCEKRLVKIPDRIAKKARKELDRGQVGGFFIASASPDGKTVTVTETTGDPYLAIVEDIWPDILHAHNQHADKKPVVLYDLQEHRIYVYPCEDFKADMNERSQRILTKQYIEATANGQFVVFVRDNHAEKLVSYTLPPKEESNE